MEVQGVVLGYDKGVAQVKVAAGACSDCTHDCPARSMAHPGVLTAEAPEPLRPGQEVRIAVPLPSPVRAATLTFVIPLAGLMIGLVVGSSLSGSAALPTLGYALAGTGIAFGIVHLLERHRRCQVVSR